MKLLTNNLLLALIFAFSAQGASALEIALIGDKSKREAFTKLVKEVGGVKSSASGVLRATIRSENITFSVTEVSDEPFAIANQLLTADLALLVVDATQGPLPITTEQLIIARQARIPNLAIFFASTLPLQRDAPKDAAELLELEEMEMRELLGKYEMKGEAAVVLFDSDVSRISKAKFSRGLQDLRQYIRSVSTKRPKLPAPKQVNEYLCYYYLLSNPEANGRGAVLSNGDRIDVWHEGQSTSAVVKTKATHKPGDNGEFVLSLSAPLPAYEASRTILARNGAVIGVGVVKSVLR
ncbi:MAG: hypothetical protein K1X48_05040 [Burkholderiaceae bacterium]|nr:hypothetical protein [Burkholderiaceae bacterium]